MSKRSEQKMPDIQISQEVKLMAKSMTRMSNKRRKKKAAQSQSTWTKGSSK
jgi:hypothetical protein